MILTKGKTWDWRNCNRCGKNEWCSSGHWPAKDGNFYGFLCKQCEHRLNNPDEWELERLELVPSHSE